MSDAKSKVIAAHFGEAEPNICPECGSRDLFFDRETGEIVCRCCGLVLEENVLDEGPEWRTYTPEERESRVRVGMPPSLSIHDKGLSTDISQDGLDSHGRRLNSETKAKYFRLKKRQSMAVVANTYERNLAQAFNELSRMAEKISASHPAREQAAAIYRKALEKGLVKGRNIREIVAACLYTALRISGTPRSLVKFAETVRIEKKRLGRCYRLIVNSLEIEVPRPRAEDFIARISEKICAPKEVVEEAMIILREAREKFMSFGKSPRGLAAAAIYYASKKKGVNFTQKEISIASGVTEVTVRNRYKELCFKIGSSHASKRK